MNRHDARKLIEEYVAGWTARDIDRFLSTLSEGAVVVECDGSTICGLDEARDWFESWHALPTDGRVTRWSIDEFLFDQGAETATVEWAFACDCYGVTASFLGASVVRFSRGRISRIHEYRGEVAEAPSEGEGQE
jgi:hypothetical protein